MIPYSLIIFIKKDNLSPYCEHLLNLFERNAVSSEVNLLTEIAINLILMWIGLVTHPTLAVESKLPPPNLYW